MGICGAAKVASPSTWMPGAAVASIVSQLTPTQRLLMLTSPALCAMSAARCGGTTFSHFFGPDRRGRRCWQNRCEACGRASEYVPTRSEIENQCRELRDPLAPIALDDEQEKLLGIPNSQ